MGGSLYPDIPQGGLLRYGHSTPVLVICQARKVAFLSRLKAGSYLPPSLCPHKRQHFSKRRPVRKVHRSGRARVRCMMRSCWRNNQISRSLLCSVRTSKPKRSRSTEKKFASTAKVILPSATDGDERS